VDEEDQGRVRPVEINFYANTAMKILACVGVWEQNTASAEKWAQRKLRSERGFTMGHTSLKVQRRQ
jgi:hypothetical protein